MYEKDGDPPQHITGHMSLITSRLIGWKSWGTPSTYYRSHVVSHLSSDWMKKSERTPLSRTVNLPLVWLAIYVCSRRQNVDTTQRFVETVISHLVNNIQHVYSACGSHIHCTLNLNSSCLLSLFYFHLLCKLKTMNSKVCSLLFITDCNLAEFLQNCTKFEVYEIRVINPHGACNILFSWHNRVRENLRFFYSIPL
jgi:hypothetical protein